MSTYLYLQCDSHEPPIGADQEAGQHLYDLEHIRKDWANRHAIKTGWEAGLSLEGDSYFQTSNRFFMMQHINCKVSIHDEYDRQHSLEENNGR